MPTKRIKPEELKVGMTIYGTERDGRWNASDPDTKVGWVLETLREPAYGGTVGLRHPTLGGTTGYVREGQWVEVEENDTWPQEHPEYGEMSL